MDMKTHITRVAMQLFARRGHAGTSMREIAEAAKLTKAALYHHFPDKDALYRAAMADCSERMCAHIAQAGEGVGDPVRRLRRIVHAHLEYFVHEGDMIRALYQNLLTPDAAIDCEAGDKNDHPLMGALRACAKAGYVNENRIEETFILLAGGIEFSGVSWLMDPRSPRPSRALGDRLLRTAIPALEEELPRGSRPKAKRSGQGSSKPRGKGAKRRPSKAVAILLAGALAAAAGAPGALAQPGLQLLDQGEPTTVDAIEGAPVAFDLDDCIGRALEANASLEAERSGRGELSGQKLQALSDGLPSLDLVGSFNRSRDPSFALDETFGAGDESASDSLPFDLFIVNPEDIPPQNFWRASLDAYWEINPFRIWNAVGAANLGSERQEVIITATEHRTVESTLGAYYSVLEAAQELEAIDAEVEAREEFLEITRRRFAVEFATALDTLQAAVSLANIRPQERQAALALRNAGAELNVLMGREPLEPLTLIRDVDVETDSVNPDRAVELALSRPDVRELYLLERIHAKNRGAQKSEHRPYLALSGSYGYIAREFDELGDDGKDTWRVSASVTVPLFDGLLTRGRVKETEARVQRTSLDRLEAERRARLEVLTLIGELEVARDDLRAAELNMSRAEDALRVTTLTYENAKADYLDVLNAQSDRFQARSNLIRARYEVLTTTASLKRAMGASPTTPLAIALRDTPQADGRSN